MVEDYKPASGEHESAGAEQTQSDPVDKLNIGQHISQQFNAELEEVRNKVLTMGGLVEEHLAGAVQAMVEGNADLAARISHDDYKVNAMEVDIDEECTQILARRQPAASDLRLVMAVIKTITDLERIGDEAERVALMADFNAGEELPEPVMGTIGEMGRGVRSMLRDALDAFARTDARFAFEVMGRDERIDELYVSVTKSLVAGMANNPSRVRQCLNVLWAARALERIGDRSRNICEYVIYLVRGKDIRHTSHEDVMKSRNG